jgi:hypothetical protein
MVWFLTLDGCWGCGRPWPELRLEPVAFAPTWMGYYCAACDVYSTPWTARRPSPLAQEGAEGAERAALGAVVW